MIFVGCFTIKIDSKNRVTIPAKFRKIIEGKTLLLCKINISNKPVIAVFPNYNTAYERLRGFLNCPEEDYCRNLSIIMNQFTMDSANRISIKNISEKLELSDDSDKILFAIGNGDYFEFWRKDLWEKYCEEKGLQQYIL